MEANEDVDEELADGDDDEEEEDDDKAELDLAGETC